MNRIWCSSLYCKLKLIVHEYLMLATHASYRIQWKIDVNNPSLFYELHLCWCKRKRLWTGANVEMPCYYKINLEVFNHQQKPKNILFYEFVDDGNYLRLIKEIYNSSPNKRLKSTTAEQSLLAILLIWSKFYELTGTVLMRVVPNMITVYYRWLPVLTCCYKNEKEVRRDFAAWTKPFNSISSALHIKHN